MSLKFEKFTKEHIEQYYAWRNDPEVAYFDQSGFLRPLSFEEIEIWSERMVEGLTFMVFDDETPIGVCAYMSVDHRNRHGEISIVIGNKGYWSKGYGTEIMKHLLDWGFEGLNLHRVYLHVYAFNKRAIGLYKKVGFKYEGAMRDMVYRDGVYHDLEIYGILASEYRAI